MNIDRYMLRINKSNTEQALLEGCRKGQADAQRELYERFAPRMMGVCMRYIHDREEAEHVMIGGMVKVYEKIGQFNDEGSFEGWIRKIMVNESLMYIRKYKNMSLEVEIEAVDHTPNYHVLEQTLEANDLLRLVGELPVGYRTVFNLYAIEGYNHKEIAKMLEINENTSKSQLSRARKHLQNRLEALQKAEIKKGESNGS
ncbi:MAG: sigma-70 family RNA polymerase sigma factor [Cyclobacteriaceae bacterium]